MRLEVNFSGDFEKALTKRISSWKSSKEVGHVLTVPHEHRWWYWIEFGTASQGEPGRSSGTPYQIPQSEPFDRILVFDGRFVRGPISHPGIHPHRPVREVLHNIRVAIKKQLRSALRKGAHESPDAMKSFTLQGIGIAKKQIVQSFAQRVTGTRDVSEFPKQSGKLEGRTAASVLDEVTTPKEIT